jgi:hypothetical protein
MTIKLQPKTKFIPGMTLPHGSVVFTRAQGTYTVETEGERHDAHRHRYTREEFPYFAVQEDGFMAWGPDAVGRFTPDYNIEAVQVAAQEEASSLFRVGDTVYTAGWGKGEVTEVDTLRFDRYPVQVKFERDESDPQVFTSDGKFIKASAAGRELFFAPIEVNDTHLNRPRDVFKPGNVVFNSRSGAVAIVSHDYAHTDQAVLFQAGGSSGPTYTVAHTHLTLIAESATTIKE